MNYRLLFFSFLILGFSCNERFKDSKREDKNYFIDKEFYSNGVIKKETIYKDSSLLNKTVIFYYSNGSTKKKYIFSNGKPNGEFVSYHSMGQPNMRGIFRNGSAIGPIYYYANGNLMLYNERDLNSEIYYVKKYDTYTHKLIKEEGFCLSQKVIIEKENDQLNLYFSFSQPDGYFNNLSAVINGKNLAIEILEGHIGLIKLKLQSNLGKELKIFSRLKFNSQLICSDSITKAIYSATPHVPLGHVE